MSNKTRLLYAFTFLSFLMLLNLYISPLIVWKLNDFKSALNYFIYYGAGGPFALYCFIAALSNILEKYWSNSYKVNKNKMEVYKAKSAKELEMLQRKVSESFEKLMEWESINVAANSIVFFLQGSIAIALMIYYFKMFQ